MYFKVLLISALLFATSLEASYIHQKFWLISCPLSGCTLTFNACLGCYGERNCKQCITSIKPDCSPCAEDIFDDSGLETVNGNKYLLCDATDPFQVTVCHFHCRGRYYQTGQCTRLSNVPICECLSQPISSNTSTTTASSSQQTTPLTYDTTTLSTGSSSPIIIESSTTTSFSSSSIYTTLNRTIPFTSTQSTATTSLPPTFNGILKFNFSISTSYQKLFALANGELLRGSYGNEIEVWDSQKGTIKRKLTSNVHRFPYLFGLLSNGDLVVGYLDSKAFLIWDIGQAHGEYVKRTISTNDLIISLAVLSNDDLAIGQQSNNYDILIRDSQNGHVKKRLIGHKNAVYDIISLPNGNLASCSADGTVRIWDLASSSLLNTFVHLSPVYSMAILNNGELITGLSDGSAEVWNLATGDQLRSFYIHALAFCRNKCIHVLNNGQVISGSHDFELKIWNPLDGSVRQSFRNHRTPIYQLEFSKNGNLITSSSSEIAFWA